MELENKQKIKNVQLAFPCDQDFAGIEKNENFCTACSKRLHDFRDASAEELERVKKQGDQPVCGIFRRQQLAGNMRRYAAAGSVLLLSGLGLPAMAQTKQAAAEVNSEKEGAVLKIPADTVNNAGSTSEEVIFGTILEEDATIKSIKGKAFEGGGAMFQVLSEALNDEIKYPEGLTEEGRVFIQLQIDKEGKLTDVKLMRGFHPLAEEEAIRALWALEPAFYPAKQADIPIRCQWVIPVTFKK